MSYEWSIPFRFSDQDFIYVSHLSMHATCPAQLNLLDLITLIIFDEAYKLQSSYCGHLQPSTTSSGPSILFSALFSNTLTYLPHRYS